MIDEKKIEEAAYRFATSQTHGELLALIDGYKEGYKDAINEFIKDLWHPVSEEPNKARVFLYKTIFKGYGLNIIIDGNEWKYIIKYQKATQWLYIDDLFPKKRDTYD